MPAYAPASADESDAVSLVRGSRIAQANTRPSKRSRSRSSRTTGRATRTSRASPSRPSATVPINDKMIVLGLQAHNHWGGLISYFNADRGGQAYAYKPELP